MKPLLFLLLAAIPAAAQQPDTICKIVIQYPASNPEAISITVPEKQCDTNGIRHALSYLVFRMSQHN